jgi:hypothetical protein
MFRDIARYVRNCQNCLAYKAFQGKPAHAHNVTLPWQQVTTDLIGPLPRSQNGHFWLLVMQDRFTKWVELEPLHKATGDAVTKTLATCIVYRHGCLELIISDNGKQFRSRQFTAMLRFFRIKQRTTPVYTPQCNPVERTKSDRAQCKIGPQIQRAVLSRPRDHPRHSRLARQQGEVVPAYLRTGPEAKTEGGRFHPH